MNTTQQTNLKSTLLARPTLSTLFFTLLILGLCMPAKAQTNIPQTYIGMIVNSPNSTSQLSNAYGILRIWDSGNQWPNIQYTSTTVFDWGDDSTKGLDWELRQAKTANPNMIGFYTLNRTPNWALSATNKTDESCVYWLDGNSEYAHKPGQCWPPQDLNTDGSGTDADWINWVIGVVSHVNASGYSTHHIPIKYWEVWNEFDVDSGTDPGSNVSFKGTNAQLVRMAEDAYCIIEGGNFTIHGYMSGAYTCQSYPLIPAADRGIGNGAKMVMPSAHDNSGAFTSVHNFLYGISSRAGANVTDIINFHMKPGNETTTPDPEAEMADQVSDIQTSSTLGLTSQELAKPLWNGESGYSGNPSCGWCGPKNGGGGPDISGDTAAQVAFIGRYNMIQWSLGIQNSDWYMLDGSNTLNTADQTAYEQTYKWLVAPSATTTMSTCTTSTGKGGGQTLYTCSLNDGTGSTEWKGTVIWDTSCSTSGCGTNYTPACNMLDYNTLNSTTETPIPACPNSRVLNNVIGLQPVLFENKILADKP